MRKFFPLHDDREKASGSTDQDGAPRSEAERFWSSNVPARGDGERPTVRPSGEPDAPDARESSAPAHSGVHGVVPISDGSDVSSIEAALLKLLAG